MTGKLCAESVSQKEGLELLSFQMLCLGSDKINLKTVRIKQKASLYNWEEIPWGTTPTALAPSWLGASLFRKMVNIFSLPSY